MNNTKFIQSPLNYTGGKYKLLNQIYPLLDLTNINNFIDLFCGGLNVGIIDPPYYITTATYNEKGG